VTRREEKGTNRPLLPAKLTPMPTPSLKLCKVMTNTTSTSFFALRLDMFPNAMASSCFSRINFAPRIKNKPTIDPPAVRCVELQPPRTLSIPPQPCTKSPKLALIIIPAATAFEAPSMVLLGFDTKTNGKAPKPVDTAVIKPKYQTRPSVTDWPNRSFGRVHSMITTKIKQAKRDRRECKGSTDVSVKGSILFQNVRGDSKRCS